MHLIDDFDTKHLWHPYTSATNPLPAYQVKSCYDRTIELVDGTKMIDAMSSWWCCVHGYNIKSINEAIKEQVDTLSHVMFAGLTHNCAIDLGKRLLELLPYMEHIFYADSGSVASEVALKMALQYQYAKGRHNRNSFASIAGGYHGDTWNAMSLSDPSGMHKVFASALPIRYFASRPQSRFDNSLIYQQNNSFKQEDNQHLIQQDLKNLEFVLKAHQDKIAALIIEPIMQGAGGMHFYHPAYLVGLRALCDELDIVLIADEIATGFGRTGKLFACEHAPIKSDIMLLGKGLTAGYMTLSCVLCQAHIAQTISKHAPHVFMHGPTFMANPLACRAAIASIDYLFTYDYLEASKNIERVLSTYFSQIKDKSKIKEIRQLGAIAVVEMHDKINVNIVSKLNLKTHVHFRPMGNLLYCMPPLTTTQEELEQIGQAFITTIDYLTQLESKTLDNEAILV